MQYHPEILELHLSESDVQDPKAIVQAVREIKTTVPRVYLHHPSTFEGQYLDIISASSKRRDFYDWSTKNLIEICRETDSRTVIHANYAGSESSDFGDSEKLEQVNERIRFFQGLGSEFLLWENSTEGIFSAQNPRWISELVEPLQLQLCVDVSHVFLALNGDNAATLRILNETKPYAKYYHVVDSMGNQHDGLPLGAGRIDWRSVKPYVVHQDFIFEIDLRDSKYSDCTPMIESAEYFRALP